MFAPTFHDSEAAFQGAIDDGHLSDDPSSPIYAAHYMYMGTVDSNEAQRAEGWMHTDLFKHRHTRRYIEAPCTWIA